MCTGKVVLGLESTNWHCECSFMVEPLSSMCKTIGSVSCKETKQQQKASKQELTKVLGRSRQNPQFSGRVSENSG